MTRGAKIAAALAGALLLAQLVPVSRTNPQVQEEMPAPPEVRQLLKRSCYDCHSHETRWPWYSHVAPMSWLLAYDVAEGREHLNFSTWNAYDEKDRRENLEEALEEVEEGNMPMTPYLWLHRDAVLSDADRALLKTFVVASGGEPEGARAEGGHHHRHSDQGQ